MYDHKINDKVRFRIMDTFHRRDSEVGNLLDYDENEIGGRVNWQLSGRQELVWNVSYLNRGYDTDYFNSYRYLLNGLTLQYNKPKKVDWLIRGELQQLRFDRANAASPYALFDDTTTLNKVEGRYNFWIGDDKRVKFTAMRQKTYYKSFDNISQELLLDFTRPLTVTEFIGELEYNF